LRTIALILLYLVLLCKNFNHVDRDALSLIFLDNYQIVVIYGQLAKLYCCQSSMILSFEMRKRSRPIATYGLPVAGLPNNGPVFVPLFVHLINTLSPFAKLSSCTVFYLIQLLLLQMHISLFLQGHDIVL
jgi:hypothetical protein